MKSSQSNFNLRSPSSYLARSYLIATVHVWCFLTYFGRKLADDSGILQEIWKKAAEFNYIIDLPIPSNNTTYIILMGF